jgi:hypothetical protein
VKGRQFVTPPAQRSLRRRCVCDPRIRAQARQFRQPPAEHVKYRREDQAEQRDTDHAGEQRGDAVLRRTAIRRGAPRR